MKLITKVMTMVAFAVGLLGIPDILAERDYDAKTVETIQGRVLSIEKTTLPKRRGYWVDLMLQTGNGTIAVELGPAWFIDKHTPRIEANDTITVTGSRVTLDGRSTIVAADITRGNELLKLRDNNGVAFWPRTGAVEAPRR
jgi:DNA/RNA endonuclease YhcR with UshA esterase domain